MEAAAMTTRPAHWKVPPGRNDYSAERTLTLGELVRQMRVAQAAYRKHGSRTNKNRRVVLERLVDERLGELA